MEDIGPHLGRDCSEGTHKRYLELQGHHPKIQHLYHGPEDVVGSESGDVDVLEFLDDMLLPSSLG